MNIGQTILIKIMNYQENMEVYSPVWFWFWLGWFFLTDCDHKGKQIIKNTPGTAGGPGGRDRTLAVKSIKKVRKNLKDLKPLKDLKNRPKAPEQFIPKY